MSGERPGEMRIGEVLAGGRERAGLEINAVEERTKIRAKYLRALEAEEWDSLPSPAYAKGFLRTYAQLLGLDAEALVDEYRRQVERELGEPTYPLGDQVLERRRRPSDDGDRPRLGLLLGLAGALAVGVVVVVALSGGDDEPEKQRKAGAGEPRAGGHDRDGGGAEGTAKLALLIHEPVEVCLLGGGGEALIDGQVLAAGDRERFERQRFELRFPAGFAADQLTVNLAGKQRLLPKAEGPAAYAITAPQRVRALAAPGKRCP